ncbi:MAG: hydrolase CocE/NonD family protein [Gemmatimonadetes bacterium]|nr:hydrolase CocE/NonD family protein [Gemmatimonadota bacterium]
MTPPIRLHMRLFAVVLCAAATLGAGAAHAQQPTEGTPPIPSFDKTEAMVSMRDGVKLHTNIFVPKGFAGNLPIVMVRTPYGIEGGERSFAGAYAEMARDGYIFVFQDIRGRFKSEGQFVMLRQMRQMRDPKAIDEATDTYDSIEWLLKNVPRNNGRVGMMGVSYPGWLTVVAMLDPHPALKAVSPQASPADMFIGDDFHHNGAFRLSYGFEYAVMMETNKEQTPFAFGDSDTYDWYLKLGSLAHVNEKYLHDKIPSWNDFATHASYDAFWQRQAVAPYVTHVTVPTLSVAGWWDQEDFYGPIKIYELLEKHDTKHLNYLVVGPWNHGGWSGASGKTLGPVDFGSATAPDFRQNIEAPWFAYWLKGIGKLTLPEATTFEAGSNTWERRDSWPLRPSANATPRRLYLQGDHRLSFTAPADRSANAFDAYLSDPANPVPYRARPIKPTWEAGSTWSRWLADDQRFVQGRPDVVSWQTAPLDSDIVIAGDVTAHLFASTTGSDADWVVKVIDVYPDAYEANPKMSGYELMVANDVLRGRFRQSFEKPVPITPNHVDQYVVDLHTQDYKFKKGHRIMVQVQSSWFPLIDRNPQTFVPNIFEAKDTDFKAQTHKVFRSRDAASYVQVTVVRGGK